MNALTPTVTEHETSPSRPWMLYNSRSDYAASVHWHAKDDRGATIITRTKAAESDDIEALTAWCEQQAAEGASSWCLYTTVESSFLEAGRRDNFFRFGWDRDAAERIAA